MLPYRALGFPLDPEIAFVFGLALSLAANAVTVVGTFFVGLHATASRRLALAAAALYAFWPLLAGLVGGSRAWGNGTWTVDAGLVLYTEPLSTTLVTSAMAALLAPRLSPLRLALGGVALSFATAVKLTNALLAAAMLVLLAVRVGPRRTLPYLAGALSFVPVVATFWPKGYASLFDNPHSWPRHPFSAHYALTSWTDSLLFSPRTLLVLVPFALVGALALPSRWNRAALAAWALANPLFYSFYRVTWEHPRFLFASLPAVFVLWVAGVARVADAARQRLPRGSQTSQSPARDRT
jgi:hypothetical protein